MPEQNEVKEAKAVEPQLSDAERFAQVVSKKIDGITRPKAAIFTHATPDPDAIGSQMAIKYLLAAAYGIDSDCFVDGEISHPQNKMVVQLLDPHLVEVSTYKASDYCLTILVDTIPNNAGIGKATKAINNVGGEKAVPNNTGDEKAPVVVFDIVIDHHKELPDKFSGTCFHYHCGSCCSIIHQLLQQHDVKFDPDNEEHVKIATAIIVGVITDTEFCTKLDTTNRDFIAHQNMFKYSDPDLVRKIVNFKWPMSWVKLMGIAINEFVMEEGVAVVGLGMLDSDQYDAVAAIADWMLSWGNIQTAIAFAFFDGQYVSGSVRTVNDTIEVHQLCDQLGGKNGKGSGKNFAGRYYKPLGAFAFEHDEEKPFIDSWWDLQKQREIAKIFKVFNK